jgi:hypothetical protein
MILRGTQSQSGLFAVGKNQLPVPVFEPWFFENLDMLGMIIPNMVERMDWIKVAQDETYSQGL